MSLQIQPIFAALRKHKLNAILLVWLVAFACAIVINVAFMIQQRMALIDIPSGVADNQLVMLESINLDRDANQIAQQKVDLAALRKIPGVKAAAAVDALPFNQSNWINGIARDPAMHHGVQASAFNGSPGELAVLGLKLVGGRAFRPEDYVAEESGHSFDGLQHVAAAIITRAMAKALFPGQNALGKSVYTYPNDPIRIVGIVERLARPNVATNYDNDYSILYPMRPDTSSITYVLRTAPQARSRVLKAARSVLYKVNRNRVVRHAMAFTQLRDSYFQRDRTMIWLLIAAALGLLFVAALGIGGLASFWVQSRTRTIGIRRAVGATRRDILRYFQTENFLIVGVGVVLGVILAVVLNLLLMSHYELPRLPLWYLAVGAVALWVLGQLAVLAPALRASKVPPVVATRSV